MNKHEKVIIISKRLKQQYKNNIFVNQVDEVLQELVERATPKKPQKEFEGIGGFPVDICPNCGWNVKRNNCCSNNECRQALDWSE